MCEFASFVLTKDQAFWLTDSESHEGIIKHYNLQHLDKDPIGVVRVEINPPETSVDNLDFWEFNGDQDVYPDWTYRGDPSLEIRTREALRKRSVEEKWFEVATGQHVVVGKFSDAIAGDYGIASAGNFSTASAGNFGTASVGDYGTASVGIRGTASAGNFSTAVAGNHGSASAGDYGTASAEDYGSDPDGIRGTVSAGYRGTIIFRWIDSAKKKRHMIGHIGEGGLEPDTKYRVEDGAWVKVN